MMQNNLHDTHPNQPGFNRVLCVFGTRPEAIKMAPVVRALRARSGICTQVCVTGQHRTMLDQVTELFDIQPDFDLDIMRQDQDLTDITSRVLTGLRVVISKSRPDLMLVHGDTTTAMAASLAGFYHKVKVGHVEAGLRTGNPESPWPEEMNRRVVSVLAEMHFAPTNRAGENLLHEGVAHDKVYVTGNTVVDALLEIAGRLDGDAVLRAKLNEKFPFLDNRKTILVTGHRRESLGSGFESICRALAKLSARNDVNIVYPVHLNPNVREPVFRLLAGRPNVHLCEPLDYLSFVYLMMRSHLILTDSGGIQEEAPALGRPVLVMRNTTERPEAIAAGVARLVGSDTDSIVSATTHLLDEETAYKKIAHAKNPFGDGHAGERIADAIASRRQSTGIAEAPHLAPSVALSVAGGV